MQCFILFNMFLIVSLFTFLSETFFMDALKQYWLKNGPQILKSKLATLPLKKGINIKNISKEHQRDLLTKVVQKYTIFTVLHQDSRVQKWLHFNPRIMQAYFIYLCVCDQ